MVPTKLVPALKFDVNDDSYILNKLNTEKKYENCWAFSPSTPGSSAEKSVVIWESEAILHAMQDFLAGSSTPGLEKDNIFDESSPIFNQAMTLSKNVQNLGLYCLYISRIIK